MPVWTFLSKTRPILALLPEDIRIAEKLFKQARSIIEKQAPWPLEDVKFEWGVYTYWVAPKNVKPKPYFIISVPREDLAAPGIHFLAQHGIPSFFSGEYSILPTQIKRRSVKSKTRKIKGRNKKT